LWVAESQREWQATWRREWDGSRHKHVAC